MVSGAFMMSPPMTMFVARPFLRVIFDNAVFQLSVPETALTASNAFPGLGSKPGPSIWVDSQQKVDEMISALDKRLFPKKPRSCKEGKLYPAFGVAI